MGVLAYFLRWLTSQAMQVALMDEEARIRRTVVEFIQPADPQTLAKQLANMLYDPVKTVRIEAARRLAGYLSKHLDAAQKALHQNVLQEYEAAMKYSADFSFARYNLANLYNDLAAVMMPSNNSRRRFGLTTSFIR